MLGKTTGKDNKLFSVLGICIIALCTSCNDDVSKEVSELGAACNSEIKCNDGLKCVNDVCIQYVGKTEACDQTHICTSPLVCDNKVCIEKSSEEKTGADIGAACNNETKCKSDLECVNNVCIKYVGKTEACY